MRKIKFRCWDSRKGIMYDWDDITIWEKPKLLTRLIRNNYEGLELMQYTGFDDKKGKEVYEGDIVLIDCGYSDENLLGEIKFIDSSWQIEDYYISDRYVIAKGYDYEPIDCEVIGNIYENPKLLNNDEDVI